MKLLAPYVHLLASFMLCLAYVIDIAGQTDSTSSLIINTSPGTIIWVDSLRYGAVPESGELRIDNLRAGSHTVRARLKGTREITQSVTIADESPKSIELSLSNPADKAELSFQTAEELRESGKHADAVKEYRKAVKLRARGYPAARIGLARSLYSNEYYDEAISEARKAIREKSGLYPEAYTVIGNIKRTQGLHEEAVKNYETALTQARDIMPEAHTGLALAFQDRNHSEDAIKHLRIAIVQANDTEPILYFLLGSSLEREYRNKEAVEAYEKYLRLEPNTTQASALRSVLRQLRREIR